MKRFLVLWLLVCLIGIPEANAQVVPSQDNQSHVAQNGFELTKVVSNTTIETGVEFLYYIYFVFPVGTTSATITDVLDPDVSFQSIQVSSACGTPTVSAPSVGAMGGTVTVTWGAVPAGCAGSICIKVMFPNGTTCNGTEAVNRACLVGGKGPVHTNICTRDLTTIAVAENPWSIGKYVLDAGVQSGSCSYISGSTTITYNVCVRKTIGTTGQMNLDNAVVTDVLPSGATLVSSNCNAVQNGTDVTWLLGNLDATSMYNKQCCTLTVEYPSNYINSQVTNQATLTGVLGSANNPCGDVSLPSNQTCVEIVDTTIVRLRKFVYTNGMPGCAGRYRITLYNEGTTTLTGITITDDLPDTYLENFAVGYTSSGLDVTLIGSTVTATLTGSLLPGQSKYFYIEFTIKPGVLPGTIIKNCAEIPGPAGVPLYEACRSFTVAEPLPKPCLWKQVCDPQTEYSPSQIIRFRLRIQNIGGKDLTGASITDVLNNHMDYVGNAEYYTGTSWNTPCHTGTAWTGVNESVSGNTITFTLPDIPALCQDMFYGHCGMYGTGSVPYYFIEFDVKIRDDAALGVLPNFFTISGGNLTTPLNSNTVYIPIGGTAGYTLKKMVSLDGTTWGSSIQTQPGSSADFRLLWNVDAGSVGLYHGTFVDLMPLDCPPDDKFILSSYSDRGSTFDLTYQTTVSTSGAMTEYSNPDACANINNFDPSGFGLQLFNGYGSSGTWSSALPMGAQNIGFYCTNPVTAGNSAEAVFTVDIPPNLTENDVACNTFALNALILHYLNSSYDEHIPFGALESQTACIGITVEVPPLDCDSAHVFFTPSDQERCCYFANIQTPYDYPFTMLTITELNPGYVFNAGNPPTGWTSTGTGTSQLVFTHPSGLLPGGLEMGHLCLDKSQMNPHIIEFAWHGANGAVCWDTVEVSCLSDTGCFLVDQAITSSSMIEDSCCYSIEFYNNWPNYFTSVSIEMITPGAEVSSAGSSAMATTMNAPQSVSWTHSSGIANQPLPQGTLPAELCVHSMGASTMDLEVVWYSYFTGRICRDTIQIVCDTVAPDPCEDITITGELSCEGCCKYILTIENPMGYNISTVTFETGSEDILSIDASPCTPFNTSITGSNGSAQFSPACTLSPLTIEITTNPGDIALDVLVVLSNDIVCRFTDKYTCEGDSCCDVFEIFPKMWRPWLNTGYEVVIHNAFSSPIVGVDITTSSAIPLGCLMNGRYQEDNDAIVPWTNVLDVIPNSSAMPLDASKKVRFWFGAGATCSWSGMITITTHHANGKICTYTGRFRIQNEMWPVNYLPYYPIDREFLGGAYQYRYLETATVPCKWLLFNLSENAGANDMLVGAGPDKRTELPPWCSFSWLPFDNALAITFDPPLEPGVLSPPFYLFALVDSMNVSSTEICWCSYDEDGVAVESGCMPMTVTGIHSFDGSGGAIAPEQIQLLHFFPNPTNGTATLNYALGAGMHIRLELYSTLGKMVEAIDSGWRDQGLHSIQYTTRNIPAGTYYVRLSSGTQTVTKQLTIVK